MKRAKPGKRTTSRIFDSILSQQLAAVYTANQAGDKSVSHRSTVP